MFYSPLNTVEHLFCDGLFQNRLRSGRHLSSSLLELNEFANDYDFLVAQDRPIKDTSFSTLDFSHHSSEAALSVADIKLGVGTILYNNSLAEITRLLASIEANFNECSFPCQFHVWDNSPDPIDATTFDGIFKELSPQISLHPENPGFAIGHNGLMKQCFSSGCTHYLGLNPDGHLLPRSIENALRFAQSKEGAVLIELDAEPVSHPKWYHPVTVETDWVSGAAFLLDEEAFRLTRGFDPDFPLYCEDVDLSFRAFQAGVGLFVAPNARYYHDTSYRFYTEEPWRRYKTLIGTWYLCEKWGHEARANQTMQEMQRVWNPDVELPQRPEPLKDVDPHITKLLFKERFARSRFWGG